MTTLVADIKQTVERDGRVRMALLAAFTFVLGIAFMALLITDQVRAAAL